MSFDALKRNSGSAIANLVSAAEKVNAPKKSYGPDETFWAPTIDKAGNGYAVIRFLPAKEGEDLPWVQYWDHGFQGPTGLWYIENSLTTLGEADPVSEANSILWNSGVEEDKQTVRDRKRRLHYVSNILVVSDKDNPENEGKVFKYKFGKKIFDKIMDVMQPQFEDEIPVNPFDFWTGANFRLKIRKVEGYRNYDKSEFADVSELFDGDETQLKEVYDNLYSLAEIVSPKNFKSYAELKAKFNKVIGAAEVESQYSTADRVSLDERADGPSFRSAEPESLPEASNDDTSSGDGDSADKTLSFFAELANRK